MTYSNDTHLAEEDTSLFERVRRALPRKHERAAEDLVRDLRRHGYLECPDDAIVDASAHATVTLTFTAPEGTAIPAGTLVRVGDPDACPEYGAVVFATDAEATVGVGEATVDVAATAVTSGRPGNVAAGELAYLVADVTGVTAVTNAQAATGGADHQLTRAAVYRVMELAMMDLVRERDDPFDHKRSLYARMYKHELERVMAAGLDIDLDGDGEASQGERDVAGHGFHRFGRG